MASDPECICQVSLLTTRPLQAGDRLTLAYVSPEWRGPHTGPAGPMGPEGLVATGLRFRASELPSDRGLWRSGSSSGAPSAFPFDRRRIHREGVCSGMHQTPYAEMNGMKVCNTHKWFPQPKKRTLNKNDTPKRSSPSIPFHEAEPLVLQVLLPSLRS